MTYVYKGSIPPKNILRLEERGKNDRPFKVHIFHKDGSSKRFAASAIGIDTTGKFIMKESVEPIFIKHTCWIEVDFMSPYSEVERIVIDLNVYNSNPVAKVIRELLKKKKNNV